MRHERQRSGCLGAFLFAVASVLILLSLLASYVQGCTAGALSAATGITGIPGFTAGGSTIPTVYIPIYQTAASHYRVSWYLLASIHLKESNFSTSSAVGVRSGRNFAGCCSGPMQFNVADGTWAAYQDSYRPIHVLRPSSYPLMSSQHPSPYDDFDAIAAAASKLQRDGADENLYSDRTRNAVFAYNHSDAYVDAVLRQAKVWEWTSGAVEGLQRRGRVFYPVQGWSSVTSPFGDRDGKLHTGVDIGAPHATPVVAYRTGTVIARKWEQGGYGWYLDINHGDHVSRYGHLAGFDGRVVEGAPVGAGQRIGFVGSTGNSTGDHLHFEIIFENTQICPLYKLPIAEDRWDEYCKPETQPARKTQR